MYRVIMKKLFTVLLACGMVFLMAATVAQAAQKQPRWLLVIMSKQTDMTKQHLVLHHAKIERVLLFSDRPYRLVKHMTGEKLKNLWDKGKNSFEKDPPNAAVVVDDKVQTVVLNGIQVQKDKTIFNISADNMPTIEPASGNGVLFIDIWCPPGYYSDGC